VCCKNGVAGEEANADATVFHHEPAPPIKSAAAITTKTFMMIPSASEEPRRKKFRCTHRSFTGLVRWEEY
jgi:hypothetical protein